MTRYLIAAALAAAALTGCGREVDLAQTGARPVPGANALYFFCHGNIAIYFSNWDTASDDYEFIVYDSPFCAPAEQGPALPPEGQPRGQEAIEDGDDK